MNQSSSRSKTTFQHFLDTVRRGLQWLGIDLDEHIQLKVHIAFDEEVNVWYIAESDIPGLRLEADDPMELVRRVSESVAELVELNCAEVVASHHRKKKAARSVSFTPVFDSPLPALAYA